MVSIDNYEPYNNIFFYSKIDLVATDQFETESNEVPHIFTDEERELHKHRSMIAKYEKEWDYYKKIVNPYEFVYTQKKYSNFPDSICFLKPLSRSYFKMIEMLDLLNYFTESNNTYKIRTAHVCEGPGGFIEAILDRAATSKREVDVSVAMTLYSNKSNVPGWRNATFFLKKNKNVKVIFGEDNTGDILKVENQRFYTNYSFTAGVGGKMDIFTADGGFDFSYDYMSQETQIFSLLLSSVRIGFDVLKIGGVFILKLFDFSYKSTVDLLYVLSQYFEEWTLYKPSMSRPCNPEHYFIGKRFTGCTKELLCTFDLWLNLLVKGEPLESLITVDYSEMFKTIINNLRNHSLKLQIEYLKKVFTIIESSVSEISSKHNFEPTSGSIIDAYLKHNEKKSYEWCVRFNMPIFTYRRRLIKETVESEASHIDLPISCQQ
jgi:23S rRNA U2552 (ribose-2'-O)-methylase RlmE/FtsJ